MRLRMLTYNIHRAIGVDRRFRPERVAEVLRHYDADVVMLQEVDQGAPRSRELDLAQELADSAGYPHRAAGYNVNLRRKGRYGNATLSRFPIVRERNIDLTIDDRKRRGCQHTTLEVPTPNGGPAGRLEVFNLHLGLSARERELQLALLVDSHEFRCIEGGCTSLVAGDFNDWRSRLRPIFTIGLRFSAATDTGHGNNGALPTFPSFSPRGPLDRIYFRGRLELDHCWCSRMKVAKVASDHLPVIADFRVVGEG